MDKPVIADLQAAADGCRRGKDEALRLMAVVGMFDGLHCGHRYLLRQLRLMASERGLQPAVFTFPEHPLSVIDPDRAPQLLSDSGEKRRLIEDEGIGTVCFLTFDDRLRHTSARDFLTMLHDGYSVDALLLGFNNRFGHDARTITSFDEYRCLAADCGVCLFQADEFTSTPGVRVSSSAVRQLLSRGDVESAAKMLCRCYSLTGTVVGGRQLGRTIGFPTANLQPEFRNKLIPAPGVYAVAAVMPGGQCFPAMVNIGHRPTVDHSTEAPLTIEVHIIHFSGDLYGRPLEIRFLRRLRDERRFSSLDGLAAALRSDSLAAISVFSEFFPDGSVDNHRN